MRVGYEPFFQTSNYVVEVLQFSKLVFDAVQTKCADGTSTNQGRVPNEISFKLNHVMK